MKKELRQKAKLSIYLSIYIHPLTCGHEMWVVTEKNKIQDTIQEDEMSFLHRGSGLSLRGKVRSLRLRVEPVHLVNPFMHK